MFLAFGGVFKTCDKIDINMMRFYECSFFQFRTYSEKFLTILKMSRNYLLGTFSNVCGEIEWDNISISLQCNVHHMNRTLWTNFEHSLE